MLPFIPELMTSYSENILPEYKSINALFPSEPAEVGSACSAMKNIPAEKSTLFLEVLETMLRELHAEKQKKEKINEKTVVVSS